MIPPVQLCPELLTLLAAELAAGNQAADCGRSPHSPQGVLVVFASDFKNRPATCLLSVDYVEINSPPWRKAEYVHRSSGHALAARFDRGSPQPGSLLRS